MTSPFIRAAIAAALACASSVTQASATPVNPLGAGNGSERCLIGDTCGKAGSTYYGALSLVNVFQKDIGLSLVRVDDALDRLWVNIQDNGGQVQALARYAGDNLSLGYYSGGTSLYHKLTDDLPFDRKVLVNHNPSYFGPGYTGDLVTIPESAEMWKTIPLDAGVPFAFVLKDSTTGSYFTSNPYSGLGSSGYANSASDQDHMVTFQVANADGSLRPHYFIAWEDRITGDFDYNDMVVEVRYVNAVPEPETYALMLAGLALLGFAARRRRNRISA